MSGKGGIGSLFSGGNLGGILGGLAGGALDLFGFPEAGIPLALATGAGTALGSTAGGLASGENVGKALTGGLESGAIGGALSGLGELATTGDFLAAPGAAATGPLGSLFSGAGSAADVGATSGVGSAATSAPATIGGTAPVTPVTAAPLGGAPAAGASGGVPASGLASTTGATPGNISGALPVAPGANLTQDLGGASPAANTFFSPGTDTPIAGNLPTTDIGSSVPGGGGSGLGKIGDYISKNPGLLLAGGGLAESMFSNNSIPGLKSLQNQAGLEAGQGNQALSALQTGQLPAGAQAQLDQATEAAKATIRSNFARMGASGGTSEAEALAGVDQSAAATKFGDLSQVAQLGLQEVGGANNLYTSIMNTQLAQDKETQDAIGRLAAALAGSHSGGTAAAA